MSEIQQFIDALHIEPDPKGLDQYIVLGQRCKEAQELAERGIDPIEPLLELLKNPEQNVIMRERIIRILGYLQALQAVDYLLQVVQNSNEPNKIRSVAIEALCRIKDKRAVLPIIQLFEDETTDRILRLKLVDSADQLEDERFVEPLTRILLHHPDGIMRVFAAQALGRDGLLSVSSFDALLEAIKNDTRLVRTEAITSLARLGDVRAVDVLLNLFNDAEPSVRFSAIRDVAISKFQDARINEALLPLLNDALGGIRHWAIAGLASRKDARAIPQIRQMLLSDSASDVRVEAVHALASLLGKDAIPDLWKAINDDTYSLYFEYTVNESVRWQINDLQGGNEIPNDLPQE
jgi:HEAT repeat protein